MKQIVYGIAAGALFILCLYFFNPGLAHSSYLALSEARASDQQAPVYTYTAGITYPVLPDGVRQTAAKAHDIFSVFFETTDSEAHDATLDAHEIGLSSNVQLIGERGRFQSPDLSFAEKLPIGSYRLPLHFVDYAGQNHEIAATLSIDTSPPFGYLHALFTRNPELDSPWQAHLVFEYYDNGSSPSIIGATLHGVTAENTELGSLPVSVASLTGKQSPFSATISMPQPDPSWPELRLEIKLSDGAGNTGSGYSAPFPNIGIHPVILNHAQGGSVITPSNYEPGGIPIGIGIPHELLSGIPEGDYYAVVFFEGLHGCMPSNSHMNSFSPGVVWGVDEVTPPGSIYADTRSTSGGGCGARFHVNPKLTSPWLWGVLSNVLSSSAIADANGIPAFAICASEAACDPIVPCIPPLPKQQVQPPTSTSTSTGISSVLFLPGIKGSALYEHNPFCLVQNENCNVRLWLPLADAATPELFMDEAGKSKRHIYVKDQGILAHAFSYHFYDAISAHLNELAAASSSGTGWSWNAFAYDWRRSLPDMLSATQDHSRLYFGEGGPLLETILTAMASSSPTGKVTILAHSNGGLVAKELLASLGNARAAELVDKLILVGVPQTGAPRALAALLYGDGESLPGTGPLPNALISAAHARTFARNSPMAYHLLPSAAYFNSLTPTDSLPLSFASSSLLKPLRSRFGDGITRDTALRRYARGEDGRSVPAENDLTNPSVLNPSLLEYARVEHARIDAWSPPPGISVYQIVGTGDPTLMGIEQYEQQSLRRNEEARMLFRPHFSSTGDGTVPSLSASGMATSRNVHTLLIDLHELAATGRYFDHSTLFEIPEVNELIDILLQDNANAAAMPHAIHTSRPVLASSRTLLVTLHSPATLIVTN
jgi:hypothetical protein